MNILAESFKETLSVSHVFTKTNHLTKSDQMIAILDVAQDLVHEGYPVLAETLLSVVKKMIQR